MIELMSHPLHGRMHAYDLGEIARLEALGWSVEKPVLISLPVVDEPPKRKPGRPPKAK